MGGPDGGLVRRTAVGHQGGTHTKHCMIGRITSRHVITVAPGTSFKEVAGALARNHIGGAPVADAEDSVLGMVSASDLLRHQAAGAGEPPPWYRRLTRRSTGGETRARTARRLMSPPAATTGPNRTVAEAARIMVDRGVERLPVVDDDGRPMGIVTRGDLLRVFRRPDEQIRAEVLDEVLVRHLWLAPHTVDVAVRDGGVTLVGELPRRSETAAARLRRDRRRGGVGRRRLRCPAAREDR